MKIVKARGKPIQETFLMKWAVPHMPSLCKLVDEDRGGQWNNIAAVFVIERVKDLLWLELQSSGDGSGV